MQYYLDITRDFLRLRNYNFRTIKIYLFNLKKFFEYKKSNFDKFDQKEFEKFILLLYDKNYSTKTIITYINSVKFFYKNIVKCNVEINIKIPKRAQKLPVVLTRNEIKLILDSILNHKHKTIIALAYSGGLRVSEVRRLRVEDIDPVK